MQLTIPPGSIRPLSAEVEEALGRLRSECELSEDPKTKALLLHEIGAIEELAEDDHAAARDLLLAVNADTSLREPLEQLAFLLERRGSFKNLPRLLERMVRVAASPDERSRALQALGDFAVDFSSDYETAAKAYASAAELEARGTDLSLARQLVAEALSDRAQVLAHLLKRAEGATNSEYRAALFLIAARLQASLDQPSEAQASLQRAAEIESPVTLQSLLELERLARLCDDGDLRRRALERQAALLDEASKDQALRRRHGIEASELTAAKRADAWLRASQAEGVAGDRRRSVELAKKARELLPSDLCVLHWLLERSDALLPDERTALLDEELGGATDPDTIAALALLFAEDAALKGDATSALEALHRCLEHEPESVVASAFEFQLLLARDWAVAPLADAIERVADRLSGEAKGRYEVMAACVRAASRAEDGNKSKPAHAQALLDRALLHGYPPEPIARLSRLFATRNRDDRAVLEATQRLLKHSSEQERPGLLLELARGSWLSGDETAALFNLEEVSGTQAGSWVSSVLTAYGVGAGLTELTDASAPQRGFADRSDRALRALSKLAQLGSNEDACFALRHLVAAIRCAAGKRDGQTTLLELHEQRPSDPVVALQLAERLRENPKAAGDVLSSCAVACDDREIVFSYHVQAGVAYWRADERERAILEFKKAHDIHPEAVGSLLSWALRSAHPDDPEERRVMLEAARTSGADPRSYALERFGLEAGNVAHRTEATRALDEAAPDTDSDLGQALWLARALWPASRDYTEAIELLGSRGQTGAELARALSFLHERRKEEPNPQTLLELSASWASSGSLVGTLEWLGAALCNGNTEQEQRARGALAEELAGSARGALRASAMIVAWIGGQQPDLLSAECPATQLANLEVSPPGCDPRRRAHALKTAESVLSHDAGQTALTLAGYNQLFADAPRDALASFHAALQLSQDDVAAWEGIRVAAERLGNVRLQADALHKLAAHTALPERAAEFMRRRAELLESFGESEASQKALERAVELDITHFDAFNRLFRRFRGEKRYDKVLELADRRLEVTNDPKEVAKLCWERARAHRGLGNMDAALADLDTVRVLDEGHPGPFALASEIYLTQGDLGKAADELRQLAALESAPTDQRLLSGTAAADLYETKLNRVDDAIAVLQGLERSGLGALTVHERLAKSLSLRERYDEAVSQLEVLMTEREQQEGRVQAARLAMALCRDQLRTPERALSACERLLTDAPSDAEALDYILEGELTSERALSLLAQGKDALLAQESPPSAFDIDHHVRLARIAQRIGDRDLRQAVTGVLVCTSMNNRTLRDELDELNKNGPSAPTALVDSAILDELFGGRLTHPIAELCRAIAPHLLELAPPNPRSLGLGRRDRLKPSAAPELFAQLRAWLQAVGVADVEAYVGGEDDGILLLPREKHPILVVGPSLKAPLSQRQFGVLGRRAFALAASMSFIDQQDVGVGAAWIAAACSLGGVDLLPSASLDMQKALNKELSRKVRKQLPEMAERVRNSGETIAAFCSAARASLDRAQALATGDASLVVCSPSQRLETEAERDVSFELRLANVAAFTSSSSYRSLRSRLGLDRK